MPSLLRLMLAMSMPVPGSTMVEGLSLSAASPMRKTHRNANVAVIGGDRITGRQARWFMPIRRRLDLLGFDRAVRYRRAGCSGGPDGAYQRTRYLRIEALLHHVGYQRRGWNAAVDIVQYPVFQLRREVYACAHAVSHGKAGIAGDNKWKEEEGGFTDPLLPIPGWST
jgi:hypothetical protein